MDIQEKGGWDIWYMMDDSDVERVLRRPETMIGSDGAPGGYILHPRSYGSFVRILGPFVRGQQGTDTRRGRPPYVSAARQSFWFSRPWSDTARHEG